MKIQRLEFVISDASLDCSEILGTNADDELFYCKYAFNRLISYHYKTSLYKYIDIYRKLHGEYLDFDMIL